MIKVTMGKNRRFNAVGGNTEIPVFPISFCPAALKSPAINKETFPVYFQDMFGTGNFFRSTK